MHKVTFHGMLDDACFCSVHVSGAGTGRLLALMDMT